MRRLKSLTRWLLVLGCMGTLFGSFESCTANILRDVADELNDQASELDGEPQSLGDWWDQLWEDDD